MLSIFTKTKTSPGAVIAGLDRKITDARNELHLLEERHGETALTAELDVEAGRELDAVTASLAEARGRIASLEAARIEAERQRASDQRMVEEAEFAKEVAAFKVLLDRRAKAAEKLRAAIEKACEAYADVLDLSREAAINHPTGKLPIGAFLGDGEIHEAVSLEIARHNSGLAGGDELKRFPGNGYRDGVTYNPNEIKPLHEKIFDGNRYAIRLIEEDR